MAENLSKEAARGKKRKLQQLDRDTARTVNLTAAEGVLAPVSQNTITGCFNKAKKARVDAAVARFSYATGTAFHALTDPTFLQMLHEVRAPTGQLFVCFACVDCGLYALCFHLCVC